MLVKKIIHYNTWLSWEQSNDYRDFSVLMKREPSLQGNRPWKMLWLLQTINSYLLNLFFHIQTTEKKVQSYLISWIYLIGSFCGWRFDHAKPQLFHCNLPRPWITILERIITWTGPESHSPSKPLTREWQMLLRAVGEKVVLHCWAKKESDGCLKCWLRHVKSASFFINILAKLIIIKLIQCILFSC